MKLSNIFSFLNRSKPEQPIAKKRPFGMSGGTYVSEDSCMEVSAFYRGVIYISTQIAKLPWDVKDKDKNNIYNNVHYLLNTSPNYEMTSFQFKLFMIQCAIVTGNGYAEIERTIDGRPVAIWPLNPKKVCAIRDMKDKLWYQVTSGSPTGDTVYLEPRDVLIFRNFHTKDGIEGQGLVGYALNTLGIALGADQFANSLFANGGMPSGVLEVPGKMSDEAYQRLVDSWKAGFGGKKTGSTAILEDGVKYSPISHSPDVLQFLESRKFSVIEIARFLGVPPTMLFDSESAKFNNVEHQNLQVVLDVLDAWAKNLESEADMKLLGGQRGGVHTEMDLYEVFRGDAVTRSTYFKNMVQIGAMSPNEVRAKEGMAAHPDGDKYFISSNNLSPLNRLDEIIDSQISSKVQPEEDNSEEETPVDETEAALNAKVLEYFDKRLTKN